MSGPKPSAAAHHLFQGVNWSERALMHFPVLEQGNHLSGVLFEPPELRPAAGS